MIPIADPEQMKIEMTEMAKRTFAIMERITAQNDKLLELLEMMGATPIILRSNPDYREGED